MKLLLVGESGLIFILCVKAERAKHQGPGAKPRPELWGFSICKRLKKALLAIFFFFYLNQPISGTEMLKLNDTAHCIFIINTI